GVAQTRAARPLRISSRSPGPDRRLQLARTARRSPALRGRVRRDDLAKPADPGLDFSHRGAAKAQDESGTRASRREVALRQRNHPEPFASGRLRDLAVAPPIRKSHGEEHAGVVAHYFHLHPELFSQRRQKSAPAFATDLPGSPNVTGEMAFPDEIGQHRLVE